MIRSHWARLAFSSFLGLALSFALFFLAALPIRHMRLTFGRKTFILASLSGAVALASFGAWEWVYRYVTLSLLIGVYRELEERKFSIFSSAAGSVLATSVASLVAGLGVYKFSGAEIKSYFNGQSALFIDQLKSVPQFKEVSFENVVWFLPSGAVVTMMLILFVSLTVGRTAEKMTERKAVRMFRLPDWLVWVFIGSLGGTFIQSGAEWISLVAMNLLTVSLAAYFFQGLAVFTYFLDRMSIWGFWRMLAYLLIFLQLFPFVCGLGILDYWFDFRIQGLRGSIKKI